MSTSDSPPPAGPGSGDFRSEVGDALRILSRLIGTEDPAALLRIDLRVFAERLVMITEELLGFLLELGRGMERFRQTNGLPAGDRDLADLTPELLSQQLLAGDDSEALALFRALIRELKIHQVAFIEGYQQATVEGSQRILQELDPAAMGRQLRGKSVKVGPVSLSAGWGPLLQQAVWEEFLRRYRRFRSMDPEELEKYYRDGLRDGYRGFFRRRDAGIEGADTGGNGQDAPA